MHIYKPVDIEDNNFGISQVLNESYDFFKMAKF